MHADNLNVVKWQNVINVMTEWFHKKCESIPDMVSLATQSNRVLRAVNAVLTRTLRLYDDLNSFLALNFFLHTRYN